MLYDISVKATNVAVTASNPSPQPYQSPMTRIEPAGSRRGVAPTILGRPLRTLIHQRVAGFLARLMISLVGRRGPGLNPRSGRPSRSRSEPQRRYRRSSPPARRRRALDGAGGSGVRAETSMHGVARNPFHRQNRFDNAREAAPADDVWMAGLGGCGNRSCLRVSFVVDHIRANRSRCDTGARRRYPTAPLTWARHCSTMDGEIRALSNRSLALGDSI
jgi:hypothetical protein